MNLRTGHNKNIFRFLLIFVLLSFIGTFAALFEQCNHLVKLLSGQKIYINSPYYPGQYPVGSSCRYTLLAPKDHQLKFKCNIQLNSQSTSTRCIDEIFYFNREGSELLSGSEFFCGSTNVERKSFLNRAIISYISTPSYSRSRIESSDSNQQNETTTAMVSTNITTTTTTTLMTSTLATVARPDAFVEAVLATAIKAEQSEDVEQAVTYVEPVAGGTGTNSTQVTATPITTMNSTTLETTIVATASTQRTPVSLPTASKTIAAITSTTTPTTPVTTIPTSIVANTTTLNTTITPTSNTTLTATSSPTTSSTTPPLPDIEATTTTSILTPIPIVFEKAIATIAAESNTTTATTTTKRTSFLSFLLASMGWSNNFLRIPLHRIFTITPYRGTPFLSLPYRGTRIVGGNYSPSANVEYVANPAPLVIDASASIARPLATTYAAGGGSFSCLVEAVEPPCECGWSAVPKVAGQANEAGVNEFPSMAGVFSVKYNKIFCGATIIHHRYLISAAHCFRMPEADSAQNIRVVVGEHDLSTVFESLYTRIYSIESIIMHENFITTSNSVRNDIALLRTSIDIEWNRSVGPACLPFRTFVGANGSLRPPMTGQRLDTAGWGTTTFGGAQSTRLLKTTLDVISLDHCKRWINSVPSGTFCTYTPGRDTCQYDSGGALYMRDTRLYAIGIVSYGFACASNQPSVNTKLSVFMRWIRSKTPEVSYCVK